MNNLYNLYSEGLLNRKLLNQYHEKNESLLLKNNDFDVKRLAEFSDSDIEDDPLNDIYLEYDFDDNDTEFERLKKRIKLFNFKEKSKIKGDGNCQFRAIADQIYNDPDDHLLVRKNVVDWLKKNDKYVLPNGTVLREYLETDIFHKWSDYCDYMLRDSVWGDHLTLLAAAEIFKVKIVIFSSVKTKKDEDPFIIISPKYSSNIIYLSHELEYHYSSLSPIKEV